MRSVAVPAAVVLTTAALSAQVPLDRAAADLRSFFALQALDRYLETWNSRDPRLWASSLHFPHVRPGPGAFELSTTPEQYAAGVNFEQTLATGWHHSEWTSRRVLQVGWDTVHVAGAWMRYTADDKPTIGSAITYVITNQDGRWGVLSRFAAGPTGLAADQAALNTEAAREAVQAYFRAWNSHDPKALASAVHVPYVRIGDGRVDISNSADEFMTSMDAARQRTWFATRLEAHEVVQVGANGVNVTVTYSRQDRSGQAMSRYEALLLAVRRDGAWRIQAVSSLGT
jgi:hypothetical protein